MIPYYLPPYYLKLSKIGLGTLVFFMITGCLILTRRLAIDLATVGHYVETKDSTLIAQKTEHLRSAIQRQDARLMAKIPKSNYLVINTSANEFVLYNKGERIHQDKCSTGSYIQLRNGDQQSWFFKTPKGAFKIRGKTTAPVWKKPDWAFVEQGLPIPAINHSSRFEHGVLGDYALSLGDGYLIHGTLYQRFLGLPVTHGCVRLSDQNLSLVFNALSVNSKVYIY